jgi:hypothetical protein
VEFIALPVAEGNSSIVKGIDEKYYVIDGGNNKKTISSMVKEVINEESIEVLVCTHYDADHINGVIGLIESDINIKEIWLPSVFGSLVSSLFLHSDYTFLETSVSIKQIKNKEEFMKDIKSGNEEFRYKENLLNDIDNQELSSNFERERYGETASMRKEYRRWIFSKFPWRIKILLDAIAERKSPSVIRWFEYCHMSTFTKIEQQPLIGLNCIEVDVFQLMKSYDEILLTLTIINKMSLVFLFEQNVCPNVLFTSDSDFGFRCMKSLKLKKHSIVTAPHHGAEVNQKVYSLIDGDSLIYVRSDSYSKLRPCTAYIELPIKYCTICNTSPLKPKQKVSLGYDSVNGNWKKEPSIRDCECNKLRKLKKSSAF